MRSIARGPARSALRATLLAALAAGCGGEEAGATRPSPPRGTGSEAAGDAAPPPPPSEVLGLLVVDQDAGGPTADGTRAGALLLVPNTSEGFAEDAALIAIHENWLDPADALELPDGSWLLLESRWSPDDGPSRGAIFRLSVEWHAVEGGLFPSFAGTSLDPQPWWTDARARQPVALARGPDGTVYVSDREADPLGLRAAEPGRRTGCVFAIRVGADGRPARTEVLAAGPQFVTPGALLALGPRLLLLDADANPRGLLAPDGRPATPGVLFELRPGAAPLTLLECAGTTSPIALIARRTAPPELYLVDANFGTQPGVLGDGALFRVALGDAPDAPATLTLLADTQALGAHALVDPAYGDVLDDGRLVLADANADPLRLGPDGTGKGVYGAAHGALLAWDPDRPGALEVLAAGPELVTPVAVRVIRHASVRR